MRVLPGPTLESPNFSKPCLLYPGSPQNGGGGGVGHGTHIKNKVLTLQPVWMKLGITVHAVAEAAISILAPWHTPSLPRDLGRHI